MDCIKKHPAEKEFYMPEPSFFDNTYMVFARPEGQPISVLKHTDSNYYIAFNVYLDFISKLSKRNEANTVYLCSCINGHFEEGLTPQDDNVEILEKKIIL